MATEEKKEPTKEEIVAAELCRLGLMLNCDPVELAGCIDIAIASVMDVLKVEAYIREFNHIISKAQTPG